MEVKRRLDRRVLMRSGDNFWLKLTIIGASGIGCMSSMKVGLV